MNKLSTGHPSTIKSYRDLSSLVFGKDSPAVKYLDKLATESPNGLNEEIIVDERQMVHLLGSMK
jgi:hypothetical protein